ncbi:unnamed protein product [Cladocopium goreaui]|uniref:Tripartite motif-containing protein 59 (RIN G finger protein 1) n=1 Tax=Cladocopium goreaui TaxID=2562237 RepID=A0A9P1BNU2_9DINO|nr:unnamed protein product [Cladocopium goreaui]
MGAAWQRPTVGDFVLVSGHGDLSRSRRWGQLFADDGEQDRPFLVRFHDGLEPELSWCDLERVRTVDKALEDASDQEEEYQCPICFTPFEEDSQIVTPCGHCFCRSCIENALAACQTGDPTERPCPLCRQTVSLFALKMVRTGQRIHFLSDDLSCLNGSVFVLRSHSEVGFASFHFEDGNAYISHSSARCPFAGLVLDNGSLPPDKKFFEKTFWHQGSRTFHGELIWSPCTWYGSERWRIVMQFSEDLAFVTTGVMKLRSHRHACLLDGVWRVEWGNEKAPDLIRVQGGMWEHRGMRYWLNLTDPAKPCFVWRGLGVTQWCELPEAPLEDGQSLLWVTDDPKHPHIIWKRLRGPYDRYDRIVFYKLLGPNGFEYVRHHELRLQEMSFRKGQLFGNSYLHASKLGVESYHFEELRDDQVARGYISYESMPAETPGMDTGAPVPYRVPFEKTHWDEESRCFTAEVDYLRHYGSTWQGVATVTYRMVFDPEFLYIQSGSVKCLNPAAGTAPAPVAEEKHFGKDLVYINADAGRYLRSQADNGRKPTLQNVSPQIQRSLQEALDAANKRNDR